ncbi:Transducin/WD40 repeat-like superfamily protein [Heracleum sosnowskyi]|uniref:Transducin/WD40 repeat-like superfamily protein n=1 Tax=Heracleum sosnowskyi TaxID=360622 RepID=A0AAD8GWI0_9APIA|nr:Transducin/WD40 repeat-like superfamily protein [Heracleum sosnowskyi]
MNDPSMLLATSGGDTVKLFDVSVVSGDPCTLSYTPSPGFQVNSVKWNHTNLVVASAGDDRKISLWRKNGQSLGTIPLAGSEGGDDEESISSISFSNKGSRYICSGGSGQVVRIWDLQRKRCIKWLRGHTDTITGAMYNCKDEHLASISLGGDVIIHNLASAARATELKDPNRQVLRVLDYSRISRHLLVTAGDDGSVHLWDSTNRSPKVSWLKQHSAPTAGVSFSPTNDKVIASIGLDKKLYTLDSGSRRHVSCIPCEAPFSSLAFRDDGNILAAGTSSGRVVFYDVRGKPQPFFVLRAYGNSEAVTSMCWQRSKPVIVNENNSNADVALLGVSVEDSVLMPDPLPSMTSSNHSVSTTLSGSRSLSRPGPSPEPTSSLGSFGSLSSTLNYPTTDESPLRSNLWAGGALGRLKATHSYNLKDDMDLFSPVQEIKPMTPTPDKSWDDNLGTRKNYDKKSSLAFPASLRFPLPEDGSNDLHPISDWKSGSNSKQDDDHSSFSQLISTPTSSMSGASSSITPPEAWGGERLSDKLNHARQSVTFPSRFATLPYTSMSSGSMFSGLQDLSLSTSQMSTSSLADANLGLPNLRTKNITPNQDTSIGLSEHVPFNFTTQGAKGISGQANLENLTAFTAPRRFSSYAERISTTPSFSEGASMSVGSPKTKKTGTETREELVNSMLSRSDVSFAAEAANLPSLNGGITQTQIPVPQSESQHGNSFTLQLFQRALEETLASFQKSIHEDMRNLHIEIIRQFHMQEMETSSVMNSILENQAELMKEVQSLRKEQQQLRNLL